MDRALAEMPALTHWRDRSREWTPEQSDVVAWMVKQPAVLQAASSWLMRAGIRREVIRYDAETETWVGVGAKAVDKLIAERKAHMRSGGRKSRRLGRPLKVTDDEFLAKLEATRASVHGRGLTVGREMRAAAIDELVAGLDVSRTLIHRTRVRLTEEGRWPAWWSVNPEPVNAFKPKVTDEEFLAAAATMSAAEICAKYGISERTYLRLSARLGGPVVPADPNASFAAANEKTAGAGGEEEAFEL